MTVNTDLGETLQGRTRWAIAAMALAAFMAVLNGTTVTASLEAMGPALGTSISGAVWVTTVYLVAASAAVPLIGWLTTRIGSARVLQMALTGFAVGSLLCGFAWDLSSMLVFRVLQGVSGGMLEPAALAVIGLIAPVSRMGRVMGFVSLVINIGPVVGPLLGGVLVGAGAWVWIFWINVPLAALVGLAAWRLLPREEGSGDRGARIDVLGLVLLPPGFVLLLLGLNRWGAGAELGVVIAFTVVGAALLALYVRHALRVDAPLLDIRLLRIPSFAATLGVMSVVGLVMYTQLTVLPILAERSLGLEPLWRAVPVAVLGLGLLVSMTVAGSLSDTIGPRLLIRGGAAVTTVTAALIAFGHDRWPLAVVLGLVALLGLGFGSIASPAFASIYRVLPKRSVGQGTAALFITVQLFASAGVTVVGFLTEASANPATSAYILIAVAALAVTLVASLLPGRNDVTAAAVH
ncbi:EmrB/QacA subfamily drug resistance transporter [Microbacterium resistens]|uniref:EmrB/QacA subfamily drug resistance transporter n=1 Tax=Microbacterium resistens TaxID=156977 RepID=A0ABU1SDD2_9MICO|nr:DHA2 family efflux MFS transporter permease subunit [Microbacterium resistens]MDR6867613.1 EmrB/QacA subfamily drug resistance transporter [Microbacterium resistens]